MEVKRCKHVTLYFKAHFHSELKETGDWSDSGADVVVVVGQELYPVGTKTLIVMCPALSVYRQPSRSMGAERCDIRPSVSNET